MRDGFVELRPRLGYRARLDGLRALAVLLVIVSHCFGWASGAGALGVGGFFVLSGFLITALLDQEFVETERINLRYFYVRRALRLYPALLAVVVVYGVGVLTGVWAASVGRGLAAAAMALTYTTDIFTIVGKGHWTELELLLTWTLAVEEQFYLAWPLTFRWLKKNVRSERDQVVVLCAGVVFAALIRTIASTQMAVTLSPIAWTDALLIGCISGLLYRNGSVVPRRLSWMAASAMTLPSVYLFHAGADSLIGRTVGLTVFDLTVAVFVFHALAPPARIDVLGAAIPARIGRISYGLYIWHSLVLSLVERHVRFGSIAFVVIELSLTFVIAESSYRLIELPFLRRKARFQVAS